LIERSRARRQTLEQADHLMIGAALVATADRSQSPVELSRRDRILSQVSLRADLDTRSALKTYDRYATLIDEDFAAGRAEAMRQLGAFSGDRAEAAELVRGCLSIARADQQFSAEERSIVEEICRAVGADPQEFGVYDL
jgi:tellurite resistance protein TerB